LVAPQPRALASCGAQRSTGLDWQGKLVGMGVFLATSVSMLALSVVVSRVFQTASIERKRKLLPVFIVAAATVPVIPAAVVTHRWPALWQVVSALAIAFVLRGTWVCGRCGTVVTPRALKPRELCSECQAPRRPPA
jgi:hypothetical protein